MTDEQDRAEVRMRLAEGRARCWRERHGIWSVTHPPTGPTTNQGDTDQ